jgi:hypothetical protein
MVPQTVTIKQGVINVVLKSDAKALDEVVVTAMGISREKKALGYAVQDVKSEQLTQPGRSVARKSFRSGYQTFERYARSIFTDHDPWRTFFLRR